MTSKVIAVGRTLIDMVFRGDTKPADAPLPPEFAAYANANEALLKALARQLTAERNAARRMQQKAYDMTLLQEREALLNRRLEASNAALLAAQRDLEASREALVHAHDRLQAQAAELAEWNKTLEERVAAQLGEIERMARLGPKPGSRGGRRARPETR